MAKTVAGTGCLLTASGTADQVAFSVPCRQIRLRNYHATQTATVAVATGASAAAAMTAATAIAVTSGGDSWITIPAGKEGVVFKSGRDSYCAVNVIASGASTTVALEATPWFD